MHACIVQSPQVIFCFIYAAISSASGCIVLAGVSSSEAARIQTRRQCEGMHLLDTVFPSTICLSSWHCSRFGECIVRQVVPASLRGLPFVANAFPRRLRCHHLEMSSSLAVLSTKIPLRYEFSTACVMIAFTERLPAFLQRRMVCCSGVSVVCWLIIRGGSQAFKAEDKLALIQAAGMKVGAQLPCGSA
jgi:hypothetical protein